MIKIDKKLSYIFNEDIFYISNFKKLNIIERFSKGSTFDHETNELLLVEYKNEHYLFGASANSNWKGVKIDIDKFCKSKNKYYFYDRHFI